MPTPTDTVIVMTVGDIPGLSARQLEILKLVAKGYSNPEVAGILDIGVDAVKDLLTNIYARLGVSSRTEAAAFAAANNML